jgi:ferric enterobactin receptor
MPSSRRAFTRPSCGRASSHESPVFTPSRQLNEGFTRPFLYTRQADLTSPPLGSVPMHRCTVAAVAIPATPLTRLDWRSSGMRMTIAVLAMLLAAMLPAAAAAQAPVAPGTISGQVTSPEGEPRAGVEITLSTAADSTLVSGALTDDSGRFRFDGIVPGRYLLRVSAAGFKPRNSEVIELTAMSPAVDLGTIGLEVAPVALDAIEAAAEREAVVIESDRTTYNVKAMPIASTGTVIDVLRAVPELEVDGNNIVKLRGNQAVAVHMNGRPTPMQGEQLATFLLQLPGSRVDRVEVLPNPSAKHDADGPGGIVNIVMKENLDLGLSGSLGATTSTLGQRRGNGRLNYQKGRFTLFSGAGVNSGRYANSGSDMLRNLVTQPVMVIEQATSSAGSNGPSGNMDWTTELKVGRQAYLWSNAYVSSSTNDSDSRTAYSIRDDANGVRDSYDRLNTRAGGWDVHRFGGGFKQVFQERKEELTVDGSMFARGDDSSLLQEKLTRVRAGEAVDLPLEHILNDIDRGSRIITIQADYFRPLGSGRLELGLNSSHRSESSENQLFNARGPLPGARPDFHTGYDYAETVNSAYTTLSRASGKFSAQGGLRLEHTGTAFDSRVADAGFDKGYTSLFPSFNVMYRPKAGYTARLLLSRRISRPGGFYLDPYVPTTDPLNVSRGNPDLQPQYSTSFSADLTWTGGRGTIRIAPYLRRTSNIWERVRTVDEHSVATNSWLNGSHSLTRGSNFTLSLPSSRRLSGSANANMRHEARDGTNIATDLKRSAVLWSGSGSIMFKVTETLMAQATGNRYSAVATLQGSSGGFSYTSVMLRQQFGGTKGNITLGISDPFGLGDSDQSSWSTSTYTQVSRWTYTSRVASLGVTYNFGKRPQQQSRRVGDEDAGEVIRVP